MERTNDDLCTPRVVLEALAGMGEIALDPCSNRWSEVAARVKLDGSPGQCGLEADWAELAGGGLVYANPPYTRRHLPRWAAKIETEALRGVEIAALLPCSPDTRWWASLFPALDALCYWRGRLKFGGGAHGSGTFPSALLYAGPRRYLFAHCADPHGDVRLLR